MNANEKLTKITEALSAGRTIFISTALRSIKVTPKTMKDFAAINRPLFKCDETSIYISSGKRYDCIDFCRITVQ